MWLVDVELNLNLTLKKHKSNIKRMLMNIERNNLVSRSKTWFALVSTITYEDNKAMRKVGSLKVRSILDCEINQCHGFLTQASKLCENPFNVSCFFVGTLPRIYHSKKNS
jgi:hypothetical protein